MARFEKKKPQNRQQRFLVLLPVIVNYGRPAFREFGPEAKAEAVQEAVANALVTYARLVEQGRENVWLLQLCWSDLLFPKLVLVA